MWIPRCKWSHWIFHLFWKQIEWLGHEFLMPFHRIKRISNTFHMHPLSLCVFSREVICVISHEDHRTEVETYHIIVCRMYFHCDIIMWMWNTDNSVWQVFVHCKRHWNVKRSVFAHWAISDATHITWNLRHAYVRSN